MPTERNPDYVPRDRAEVEEEAIELADVLLLGDSISIGYTDEVRERLAGRARVVRPMVNAKRPENCAYTAYGLERLDTWLGDVEWEVIHFNFGLHDLKYVEDRSPDLRIVPERGEAVLANEHAKQIAPVEEYAANLDALVERLKATGARLVFATTTPVPENSRGRRVADAPRYNAAAVEVMAKHGVSVDDLYGLVLAHVAAESEPGRLQRVGNVHFTPAGSSMLAERVARTVRAELGWDGDTRGSAR